MPPAFPDPVLALSLASLHKLNDVDVDQLAHLWTVFTKCAESLESGRRLENLSWRLWFREAHLLPPDSSLSDLADATPLGTPLSLSRRGSLVGSYAAGRLRPQQLHQRLQQQQLQQATRPQQGQPTRPSLASIAAADQLSDPESGDGWSDDDGESDKEAEAEVRQGRAEQPRQVVASQQPSAQSPAAPAPTSVGPLRAQVADRKRASSSSSAFGSRARVKHHNTGVLASAVAAAAAGGSTSNHNCVGAMARVQAQAALSRRRPLSFPAAIESLVLDAREQTGILGCHQRPRPASADPAITERRYQEANAAASAVTAQAGEAPSSLPSSSRDAMRMPPPSQPFEPKPAAAAFKANEASTAATAQVAAPIAKKSTAPAEAAPQSKSKFFVAVGSQGKSFEDEEQDEEEVSRHQKAASQQHVQVAQPTAPAPHKARSEAGSTTSSTGAHRGAHNGHPHHHAAHHHGGLHGAHRSRSGAALHKAAKKHGHAHGHTHHGAHGRTGSGLTALTPASKKVELAKDEWVEEPAPVSPKKPTQKAANGASDAVEARKVDTPSPAPAPAKVAPSIAGAVLKAASPKRKKRPVTFTMGADEDDDDEFTDEEDVPAAAPVPAPSAVKTQAKPQQEQDDDEDAWSSDSSEDPEEERRALAIQRAREEAERQESMFKKVKIRSASAADLRHAASKPPSRAPSPAHASPPPVRGLLSSLFHPEQGPHPPPGQLAGRSHASAADLRHKPSQLHISPMTSMARPKPQQQTRLHSHESTGSNGSAKSSHPNGLAKLPRVPSAHPVGEGGLRTSKSAVALPVLSTAASRSSTNVRSALTASTAIISSTPVATNSASNDQQKLQQPSSGGQHDSSPEGAKASSAALARLNRLAAARGGRHSSTPVAAPTMAYSGHLEAHVDGAADFEAPQNLRRSASSGAVHREQDQQRYLASHQRPAPSESVAAPGMAHYRTAAVPAPSMPQTPRTTRRNMLRDELSESLRQNLLWERQSRNRMLGIGAPVAPPPQQTQRRETVLGGGALRPLTQTADRRSSGGAGRPAYNEEGGFHRQGW